MEKPSSLGHWKETENKKGRKAMPMFYLQISRHFPLEYCFHCSNFKDVEKTNTKRTHHSAMQWKRDAKDLVVKTDN